MKNCLAFQSNAWFQISDWLRTADMRAALRNLLCFHNSPHKKAIHWTERRAPGIRSLVSASLCVILKEVACIFYTLELLNKALKNHSNFKERRV
jgi:hypothetical protein